MKAKLGGTVDPTADLLSLYPGSDRRYDCHGISDFTLPAYQLVLLYKHRWGIEKSSISSKAR